MLLKLLICQIIACRSAPKEDTSFQKIGLIHLPSFLTHPSSRRAQASSSLTDLSVIRGVLVLFSSCTDAPANAVVGGKGVSWSQ